MASELNHSMYYCWPYKYDNHWQMWRSNFVFQLQTFLFLCVKHSLLALMAGWQQQRFMLPCATAALYYSDAFGIESVYCTEPFCAIRGYCTEPFPIWFRVVTAAVKLLCTFVQQYDYRFCAIRGYCTEPFSCLLHKTLFLRTSLDGASGC